MNDQSTPEAKPTAAELTATLTRQVRLHGERVAMVEVPEEVDQSLIALPSERTRQWAVAMVVAVGDGQIGDEVRVAPTTVGTYVLLQASPLMMTQCRCRIGGETAFVIPWGDVIGNLAGPKVSFETFQLAGRWVLCQVQLPDMAGNIFLPNGSQTSGEVPRYTVLQKGPAAEDWYAIGDEVIVNRGRATVIQFGVGREKKLCVYLDRQDVFGVVSKDGSPLA